MTDYLKKMPFTIAFIDKRGNSYEDSSRDLNAYMEFMDNGTPVADWPEILERELIEFKSHEGAEYFAKQH